MKVAKQFKNHILDLIEKVVEHVTTCSTTDWPMGLNELVSRLQKYQERLTDFTQAQLLQGLGRGKIKCGLRLLFLTLTSQMCDDIISSTELC